MLNKKKKKHPGKACYPGFLDVRFSDVRCEHSAQRVEKVVHIMQLLIIKSHFAEVLQMSTHNNSFRGGIRKIEKKKKKKKKKTITKTRLFKYIENISPSKTESFQIKILIITKTHLYNFDPLKPHFYIVKLGFTGVYIIFSYFCSKHTLWVLVRTASSRRF